jgi:hypothetical protein
VSQGGTNFVAVLYFQMYSRIVLLFLHSGNLIHNTDWCLFFRRLKINHDTNVFILESGTIANSYFKQLVTDFISGNDTNDES